MAKNGTAYTKSGGVYHPLTNSGQVIMPGGDRLTNYLFNTINAIQGKGEKAAANTWPILHLGDYANMSELNTALNGVFQTTNTKYQGHLRMTVNSQTVFVEQIAIDAINGHWAQVITGMVAPSANGSSLVSANKPGIHFRLRCSDGNDGIYSEPWQSIETVNLKTINGQQLNGTGDITIGEGGSVITIDQSLDSTSNNAISNSVVSSAINILQNAIANISTGGGVLICRGWTYSSDFNIAPEEGDYGFVEITHEIYKYTSGAWTLQGQPQSDIIYINVPSQSAYYWNGSSMMPLYGETPLSTINIHSQKPVNSVAVSKFVEGINDVIFDEIEEIKDKIELATEIGDDPNDQHAPSTNAVAEYVSDKLNELYIGSVEPLENSSEELLNSIDSDIEDNPSRQHLPTTWAVKDYVDHKGNYVFCKQWGNNLINPIIPENGDVEGEIAFDSINNTIKRWSQGDWIEESPREDVVYVRINPTTEEREYYYWNGESMNKVPKPAKTISENSTHESFPTSLAVKEYIDGIINNGGSSSGSSALAPTVNNIITGFGEPDFDDPLRPEYYLTINDTPVRKSEQLKAAVKWGIPFYDRPLRCFNGNVTGITVLEEGAEDIEVFAPAERIHLKFGMTIPYTTSDVFFNNTEGKKGFVLRVNKGTEERPSYVYYNSWKNSHEWNVRGGTTPRTDCVYSNISITNRQSTVWGYDGMEQMTEIYGLMDSFSSAFVQCLRANNGSMILSNRIYYLDLGVKQSDKTTFTIDGGKGVIFIKAKSGTPESYENAYTLSFSNCKDGVIKNMTMRTIRDNDNGAPSGHNPFSCSDSGRWAISISNGSGQSRNILMQNFDTKGFNHDVHYDNSIDLITVDGWRSRDVAMNSLRGTNLTFRNLDWEQRAYPGDGLHIIYGQSTLSGVTVEDSKFRQSSPYTSVMIDTYGCDVYNWDFIFRRCTFEGNRIYFGKREYVTFEDCTIKQIWDKLLIHDGEGDGGYLYDSLYLIQAYKSYYKFNKCQISIKIGSFMNKFELNSDGDNWVHVTDCDIFTDETDSAYSMIAGASGKVKSITMENVRTNFTKNTYGAEFSQPTEYNYNAPTDTTIDNINTNISEMSDAIASIDGVLADIKNMVYGANSVPDYQTVPTQESLPQNAVMDEIYYCTSNSKLYTCMESSVLGRAVLQLQLRPELVDGTKTTTFSICLGGNEVLEFEIEVTPEDTLTTIKNKIVEILGEEGYDYELVDWKSTNNSKSGTFAFSSISNINNGTQRYMTITAKNPASGVTPKSQSTVINIDSVTGNAADYLTVKVYVSSPSGSSWRDGKAAVWDEGEEIEGGGLVEKVYSNTSRINELSDKLTKSGNSSNRPTDVEVGYCYFDTSLGGGNIPNGKPIWASKITRENDMMTGEVIKTITWVDSTGTIV